MREKCRTTCFMGMVFLNGLITDLIKAPGTRIKCMEQEFTHGQMVKDTQANTIRILSTAMVFFTMETARFTRENGLKVSSMGLGSSSKTEKSSTEFGKMENFQRK